MCVKQRQIMCDVSAVAAIVSASFAPLARRSCQTFRGRTDTLRYALNKAARVLLLAAGAANTACTLPTPRENFDSQVAALIGKSSETQRYALRGELLVMETKLGNGNISRNYKYLVGPAKPLQTA
jgi:hypothetical protein